MFATGNTSSSTKNKVIVNSDEDLEDESDEEELFDHGATTDNVDHQNSTSSDQPLVVVLQTYSPIACRECRKGHRKVCLLCFLSLFF